MKNKKYSEFVPFIDSIIPSGFYLGEAEITKEGTFRFSNEVIEKIVYNNLLGLNNKDECIEVVCAPERIYCSAEWDKIITGIKEKLFDQKKTAALLIKYFTASAKKASLKNQVVDLSLDEIIRYYCKNTNDNKIFNVFALFDPDMNIKNGELIIKPADGHLLNEVDDELHKLSKI